MPVKPDEKYEATVTDAYMTESKNKGTAGLFIAFKTVDGSIDHTFYITPNTVDRLKENLLQCFGVTSQQLADLEFLGQIGESLRGQTVQITTKEEEYQGEYQTKVQWMNPSGFRPKAMESTNLRRVAGIFGGGPVSSPAYTQRQPSAPVSVSQSFDDDVPF